MGEVLAVSQQRPSAEAVARGAQVLRTEGVLVLPTDSVYGLACAATPQNPAHRRIFQIKKRDFSQTLPLFVADVADLMVYATGVPKWAQELARRFWPGALTLVVKASDKIPAEYRAPSGTVALRCPDSVLARELTREVGPLAQTSANSHGAPAATSGAMLEQGIVDAADLVLDGGQTPCGTASTIVDCTSREPKILREGALSAGEVFSSLE
ncbi:MAG: L-threonylcarbamoyladenylate synthase [Tractidigestivibacter sp.]|jgi:tRNA threonylcarbamoyl adenosine modification protein (Sua5/YciO/YrdC/YwlC family)|uniref:L-threonylcarbamoyladenylate synthase n=1 Tax=Tractidigestivibacter sp. TaxID=2847320 RepID=UPI003D8AC165